MTKTRHSKKTAAVALCLTLSGCMVPPLDKQIQKDDTKMDAHLKKHSVNEFFTSKTVVNKKGLYVDTTPIPLVKKPAWLSNQVQLRGVNLPFQFYINRLLAGTPANTTYQPDINRNALLTVNFTGTVEGALTYLSAQSGFAYEYIDSSKTLDWSTFVTRTFNISFMPGSINYMVGQQKGGDSSTLNGSSGSSSSSGGSGTSVIVSGSTSEGVQFSNITGKLSVWDDIARTLKTLLSKDGQATVSQSTTSITVHDHPTNIRSVERYLIQLNKEMSRQVMLTVQILEVTVHNGFDYGVNWNTIMGSLGATGNLASPVSIPGFSSTNSPIFSWLLQPQANQAQAAGSALPYPNQLFVNALKEQGEVHLMTQPSIVTLNNQVAEININTQTGYLAEVQTTVTGTTGTTQQSLIPGIVNTGFTLYALPKIQGGKVYLQLTGNLSNPPTLTTITSAGQSIQTPTVDEKRLNARTVIPSGGTLVLAGFKQIENQRGKVSPFGTGLLGGQGASADNTETVILITPIILGNEN